MRQLIRRLRACDAGAAVVEYSILIALVAVGLMGVLTLYGQAVGDLTSKTGVSISRQAGTGYAGAGGAGRAPIGMRPTVGDPGTPDPDSTSADPDSASTPAHASASSFFR